MLEISREAMPQSKPIEQVASVDLSWLQDRIAVSEDMSGGQEIFDEIIQTIPPAPSELRSKIEADLRNIDIVGGSDADILRRLRAILADTKSAQAIATKGGITSENQRAEEKKRTMGNVKEELDQKERYKAKRRLKKLFDTFGWEEKFRELNPHFHEWQTEAAEKLKLDPKDSDADIKIKLLAIQEHREEIDRSALNLSKDQKEKYAELRNELFRGVESSLQSLKISYTPNSLPPLPEGFLQGKVSDVTRQGDLIRSGDQIVDISVHPPRKYIESNGIRIETTARYENPYENLARIDICQREKITLESGVRVKAEGFGRIAKNILPNRPDLTSLDMSDPDRFRSAALDLRENLRKHFLSQMVEGGELSNEADQKVAMSIMESISQESIEETVKQIERIRELERMIAALRTADERRIPEYQERVRTQDEIGRANLAYLSSLRLGVLGQDNFQQFIDLVNAHRGQLMGGMAPELNLSEPFGVEEKRLIARALGRMLGNDDRRIFQDPPQEYELRRFALDADQNAIDDEYVRSKLRAGNPPMMDQMGRLHTVALEAALQSGNTSHGGGAVESDKN